MNASKAKGTAAETAVVRCARLAGFAAAERIALHGAVDIGDVRLASSLVAQVKAGRTAQIASLGTIRGWLADTEQQRIAGGFDHAILIVQAQGFGTSRVREWEAWTLPGDPVTRLGCVAMLRVGHYLEHYPQEGR